MVADSQVTAGIEEVYGVFDAAPFAEEQHHERMKRWVRHCIAQLSQHLKVAVMSVYSEGLSIRQAATAGNISSAAFAKRLSRARTLIRQCVQEQAEKES